MKIERIKASSSCSKCGGIALLFKLSVPVSEDFLSLFVKSGFRELSHFTKAGILYVENNDLIIHSPFGDNKLQVKCKSKNDCAGILNDLEALLQKVG